MNEYKDRIKDEFDIGFKAILEKYEEFLVLVSSGQENPAEVREAVSNILMDVFGTGMTRGIVISGKMLQEASEQTEEAE